MNPLPDWLMERAYLDEVPACCRARVAAARTTESYTERTRELDRDNQRILAALPVAEVVAEVERHARREQAPSEQTPSKQPGKSRWPRFAIPVLAGAVALAAALLLLVRPSGNSPERSNPRVAHHHHSTDPYHRSKGGPRLVVHKQIGASSQSLASGARVSVGDRLQLYYTAAPGEPSADPSADRAQTRYGAILSLDGRGTVTVHLPDIDLAGSERAQAAPLAPVGLIPLGHSYQLDDAPYFEHFVLVTDSRPFAINLVVDAARALIGDPRLVTARTQVPALTLPERFQQTWFLLNKQPSQRSPDEPVQGDDL